MQKIIKLIYNKENFKDIIKLNYNNSNNFKDIKIGELFFDNGNVYLKKTNRTAFMLYEIESDNGEYYYSNQGIFYFEQGQIFQWLNNDDAIIFRQDFLNIFTSSKNSLFKFLNKLNLT